MKQYPELDASLLGEIHEPLNDSFYAALQDMDNRRNHGSGRENNRSKQQRINSGRSKGLSSNRTNTRQ